ncbi:hypothetical protein B5S33_g1796 [[Candida] boidinii]|nr:hypothetical protein B5S30_g2587 [[Candida] boidinii]OWB83167.1 hypothetical protein B5S33_g1796 [[Candida] boidinii]
MANSYRSNSNSITPLLYGALAGVIAFTIYENREAILDFFEETAIDFLQSIEANKKKRVAAKSGYNEGSSASNAGSNRKNSNERRRKSDDDDDAESDLNPFRDPSPSPLPETSKLRKRAGNLNSGFSSKSSLTSGTEVNWSEEEETRFNSWIETSSSASRSQHGFGNEKTDKKMNIKDDPTNTDYNYDDEFSSYDEVTTPSTDRSRSAVTSDFETDSVDGMNDDHKGIKYSSLD